MTTEYLRFWLEHNTADVEPVEAILPQLARVFPYGGIVQGTATSLRRLWPLFAKFYNRPQIVLMGKLATWFQGLDLSNVESFLRLDRWTEFANYETAYLIPPGPWGVDAETWTASFLSANPDAHQIQRAAAKFRQFASSRGWPMYCYGPGLWGDDERRFKLCSLIFDQHPKLRWHNGRYADPTPTDAAIAAADRSDLICEVLQFTKCNVGFTEASQHTPSLLATRMPLLPKLVYCYFGGVANVAAWCDEAETLLKGQV